MRFILFTSLLASYANLMLASFCVAGDVPVPKQEIKYDNTGPYMDLIGMWTGTLSASQDSRNYDYQHRKVTNWDFNLYVISVTVKSATGIYCWSSVGNTKPDCHELKGTIDPVEDKLVFQWGERTLTLLRKVKAGDYHQVNYQKVGGGQFEGLAKKMEK